MNSDNFLVIVAVIAVIISFVGVGVTYNSVLSFKDFITGFATETGTVNLTVTTSAAINITSANGTAGSVALNWGSGTVTGGSSYAFLVSNGTVTGGSWGAITNGFIVENIGNVNVTLNVSSDKAAAAFLGGTSPVFQYNVSDSEANSCTDGYAYTAATYTDFGTAVDAGGVCSVFQNTDSRDTIRIDVLMHVPSDSLTGAQGAVVTLTYSAA